MLKLYPDFPATDDENHIEKHVIEVRKSGIPGAGVGVFAKQPIEMGKDLGFYRGEALNSDEFENRYSKLGHSIYVLRITDPSNEDNVINVDGTTHYNWTSRMNAPRGTNKKANVYFDHNGRVFAKRNIRAGEELLVSYGRNYWRGIDRANKTKKKKSRAKSDK
jgi:hypothetical protein